MNPTTELLTTIHQLLRLDISALGAAGALGIGWLTLCVGMSLRARLMRAAYRITIFNY